MPESINLNNVFKGKVIASIMTGMKGETILKTEDGYTLRLQPSFDVTYTEPDVLE